MKEQTKKCREHTEMFPCLKRRDIVTQASTWINLRMLRGTIKPPTRKKKKNTAWCCVHEEGSRSQWW